MTHDRQTVSNPTGAPKIAELPQPGSKQHIGYQPTGEEAASEALARQSFYLSHLMHDELWDWQKALRLDASEELALLRCLTRRALEFGDPREVANLVRLTLVALKLQVELTPSAPDRLDALMRNVLAELDQQYPNPRDDDTGSPPSAPMPPPPPTGGYRRPRAEARASADDAELADTYRWLDDGLPARGYPDLDDAPADEPAAG